jgi:hypothetical protein
MSEVTTEEATTTGLVEDTRYAAAGEALKRCTAGIPAMGAPSKPVQFVDRDAVRFAIPLLVNTRRHDTSPELFIFFTGEEASRGPHQLESALRNKMAQSSFVDVNHGNVVTTGAWKDGNGKWHAMSLEGLRWTLDESQEYWTRDGSV